QSSKPEASKKLNEKEDKEFSEQETKDIIANAFIHNTTLISTFIFRTTEYCQALSADGPDSTSSLVNIFQSLKQLGIKSLTISDYLSNSFIKGESIEPNTSNLIPLLLLRSITHLINPHIHADSIKNILQSKIILSHNKSITFADFFAKSD